MTAPDTTTSHGSDRPDRLELGPAAAERLTMVTDVASEGGHGSGRAFLGPWLADADGYLVEGASAVLADDVLGSVAVARRPEGCWSLTTDLTFERVGPRVRPGVSVTGRAELLHADAATSLAECRILDDQGQLVALGTQRGLYRPVPEEPEFVGGGSGEVLEPPTARDVDELLGLDTECGATGDALHMSIGSGTRNHVGILHGGISLMGSMIAARRELQRTDHADLVPVSAHLTFPRPVPEDEGTMQYTTVVTHAGRSFAVLRVYGMLRGTVRTMAQISAGRPAEA